MANATTFQKGDGRPRKPKGAVNKSTRLVKEVFADVFSDLQTDPKAKLKVWARENPTEFYKLASKLIPIQVAGDPDSPILNRHEVIFKKMDNGSKPNV